MLSNFSCCDGTSCNAVFIFFRFVWLLHFRFRFLDNSFVGEDFVDNFMEGDFDGEL